MPYTEKEKRYLETLRDIIIRNLQEEFQEKHLSGNLINTIKIENLGDKINIHIPAQVYNMSLYQSQGVVVHTGRGSYASKLDKTGSEFYIYPNRGSKGSFKIKPGNHKGYIDKIIDKSIKEWTSTLQGVKARKENTK